MTKLSIIVPVYNVEKYIRPCIESIFKQGIDDNDYEVIIVNDGTEDKSMEMIDDIINQHDNITVINQENQGLSVARNNGIAAAKGEFIFMPDSDDLLIENSLRPLLEKALEAKPDLIVADFISMTCDEIDSFEGVTQNNPIFKEKSGKQLFMEDLDPNYCFVWRTLYKRDFLIKANLKFFPGIRYQDIPFTHECYLKAGKCFKVSWYFIIYRKRPGAATSYFDYSKAIDFSKAIAITWNLRNMKDLSHTQLYKLEEDVYVSFSMLIFQTIYGIKKKSERLEIIKFLKSVAPHLSFSHGIKQQVTTFLYQKIPHIYIELFYIIRRKRFLPRFLR